MKEKPLNEKTCMFDNAEHIVKAIPLKDVKTHLERARKRLKELIKIDKDYEKEMNLFLAVLRVDIDQIWKEEIGEFK